MIVTEEEAKTKICCGGVGCGQIIMIEGPGLVEDSYERRCIGSACMAWRWAPTPALTADRSTTHGYCGKAGRP